MRPLIFIAGAALGLSGCGSHGQQETSQNAGENLTAQSIVSNDVTAIDAVTGDAANMAADVDMNFGNLNENIGNAASSEPVKAPRPARKKSSPPEADTTANAASNAE